MELRKKRSGEARPGAGRRPLSTMRLNFGSAQEVGWLPTFPQTSRAAIETLRPMPNTVVGMSADIVDAAPADSLFWRGEFPVTTLREAGPQATENAAQIGIPGAANRPFLAKFPVNPVKTGKSPG